MLSAIAEIFSVWFLAAAIGALTFGAFAAPPILLVETLKSLGRGCEFRIARTDHLGMGILEKLFPGDAIEPPLVGKLLVVREVEPQK